MNSLQTKLNKITDVLFPIIFQYLVDCKFIQFFQKYPFFNLFELPLGPVIIKKIDHGWITTKPITRLDEAVGEVIYFFNRLFIMNGRFDNIQMINTLLFLGHKKQVYFINNDNELLLSPPLSPSHHSHISHYYPRSGRYVLRENSFFYCYYCIEERKIFIVMKASEDFPRSPSTKICQQLYGYSLIRGVLYCMIMKSGLRRVEKILTSKDFTKAIARGLSEFTGKGVLNVIHHTKQLYTMEGSESQLRYVISNNSLSTTSDLGSQSIPKLIKASNRESR